MCLRMPHRREGDPPGCDLRDKSTSASQPADVIWTMCKQPALFPVVRSAYTPSERACIPQQAFHHRLITAGSAHLPPPSNSGKPADPRSAWSAPYVPMLAACGSSSLIGCSLLPAQTQPVIGPTKQTSILQSSPAR